ncbi:thioredoxin domain-containing protein [Niveispirillum lacus]|uniref:Thioredoxin domain-containing protein n=1 Tax=Niveispirillum lacus TaxID=1981099 RepID=A0A255Z183_9PROT|nr:thioredoxin domain-containing protein [Niveispirillum lacus]OYQ35181.1 thioredoxin domain-containing protein [Niveispirillum lacus]
MATPPNSAHRGAGNLLYRETSPYLRQHIDNPVDWMGWGPEALTKAKAEGKPILLSVGYAACHWCHVMAHESFEHPVIASLMNRLFVNIKVDREERPDLDHIYQQALALLGQQGGWPLTMFLTPDGHPFWGGTYFPPERRWGRPGFPEVLQTVAQTFAEEPAKVQRNVKALATAMDNLSAGRPGEAITDDTFIQVAEHLAQEVDPVWGGIGGAPKFPQPGIFELLWRAFCRTGQPHFASAVIQTLTRMGQGGIYDHLGGGFARYAVDAEWLVPHFEKMLYDNAQLIDLMLTVWQETRDPLLKARITETADWVLAEMRAEGGGFAASLDADSEGEEGRFYVWTDREIRRLLPADDADLFCRTYGVTEEGNWEGHTILNRMHEDTLADDTAEATLQRCRALLLRARASRVRPGWDDKVLADWNGMMIAALARAGTVLERADWLQAAQDAYRFVVAQMTTPDGRLLHSYRDQQARHRGTLEDHANMARAGVILYEMTGQEAYLTQAVAWLVEIDRHFRDGTDGGYFSTAEDADDLIRRPRHAHDNAVPSGNGTLVWLFSRLWLITGDDQWRQKADAQITAFAGEVGRNFFPLAGFLNGVDQRLHGQSLVLVGPMNDPDLIALRQVAWAKSRPNLALIHHHGEASALSSTHPAAGKIMVKGRATAYLCQAQHCSAPVTVATDLAALLGG